MRFPTDIRQHAAAVEQRVHCIPTIIAASLMTRKNKTNLVHVFWVAAGSAHAALFVENLTFAEKLNVGAEELQRTKRL